MKKPTTGEREGRKLQPIENLALLLEELRPRIEDCGWDVVDGLLGYEGQSLYPVTPGMMPPMVVVYFRKRGVMVK
jgi:hypothetical protein